MYEKQRGQVSMVTVSVFMLIFTILVVGFAYLAMNSLRQSTNDSISASASNAAEAGVEDAKRMLRYCYQHYKGNGRYDADTGDWVQSKDQPFCQQIIGKLEGVSDVKCTDVLSKATSSTKSANLQIESDGNGGQRVRVGGSDTTDSGGTNEQYYQCLKIYTLSQSYVGKISGDGKSTIVPLRLVDKYGNSAVASQITISWHKLAAQAAGGDGSITSADLNKLGNASNTLPRRSNWKNAGNLPALLRVQTARGAKSGVNVATMTNDSATAYLRPVNSGALTTIDLANYRPRTQLNNYGNSAYNYNTSVSANNNDVASGNPIVTTKCGTTGTYACTINARFSAGNFNTQQYEWYLRLTAMYKDAHFEITAKDASGNPLYFDGVQPVVDVTGKSADSYSRVKAHIEPTNDDLGDTSSWWPEYTVDTDGNVCKQINVKYNTGTPHC